MNNAIVTKRRGAQRPKGKRMSKGQGTAEAVGTYAGDAWSLAKRTAYGLNEIRKLINIETKFCDTILTSTPQGTTGNAYCISELAQGLTSTNRVGDSVRIQHLEIRGRVVVNAAATTSLVRVLVVRDLDGYGTAPTPADVLATTGAVSAPLSPENFQKRERFSILYDEVFALQSVLSSGTASIPFYFATAHQGHVLYLGQTGVAASDGKGSVYVMCVSDEGTNTPSLAFYSRMLFTDD
jgi:hypothetical protein